MPEDLSNSYSIRPNFKHKFRPAAVKGIIHDVLNEELSGKQYNSEEATSWSKHISDTVKDKLKELELDRYKFIVQVVIGEQRGEGVKVACRCLWDSDTDNYAQDIFMNVFIRFGCENGMPLGNVHTVQDSFSADTKTILFTH